jgi:hypothetical protein
VKTSPERGGIIEPSAEALGRSRKKLSPVGGGTKAHAYANSISNVCRPYGALS